MSRIRSIHPGIWTDESFMQLSAFARLLLIGIWTEAYDDGVFEWKPLTLKARIFPVDNVVIEDLLAELVSGGIITRIEEHPKKPGAIRNFQKFQRPKKPNSSGMLPDSMLDYVGFSVTQTTSTDDSSEPVRNQFGTSGEKSPQMEDGGWREKETNVSLSSARDGKTTGKEQEVLALSKAFPIKRNDSHDGRASDYLEVCSLESETAVAEACRRFKAGLVDKHNPKFAPTPAEFATVVRTVQTFEDLKARVGSTPVLTRSPFPKESYAQRVLRERSERQQSENQGGV